MSLFFSQVQWLVRERERPVVTHSLLLRLLLLLLSLLVLVLLLLSFFFSREREISGV